MNSYNSALFSPPAPVALVTLLNPDNNLEQLNVPMLLDTGADLTLVPQGSVENLRIDLSLSRQFELAGFDNKKSFSRVAILHLIFDGKTFRGEFPVINQNYGVIGRNILNLLKIQFDGQNLRWEIL